MLSYLFITEKEIRKALHEGLITLQEAHSMLLVYFQKENFTPLMRPRHNKHQLA